MRTAGETLREHFARRYCDAAGIRMALGPGRVNLLGDHTDYNDGFVLPMTVDRAVYVALRARSDDTVRLYSVNFDQAVDYTLGNLPEVETDSWASYMGGVVEELRTRGLLQRGFEAVIHGDVPLGGGLSSSAALEVATTVALQRLFDFALDAVEAVKLCQTVEHRYVGVQCGIMDQFASRLGRAGHALFLDCRSLEHRDIPLDLSQARVVIVNSGVKRKLAGSKYNERRAECQAAVDAIGAKAPGIAALRDVSPELLAGHAGDLPENVARRARHVVEENARVEAATELRANGDLEAFGALMNASHASLRDLYEVSCPELDALVEIGQGTPGVLGSRMTGAGFGGCMVNLARPEAVDPLCRRIQEIYPSRFNLEPEILALERNLEAGGLP